MSEPASPNVCIPQSNSSPPCRQMLSSEGSMAQKTAPDQHEEATIPSYQLRGNSECGCPNCHRVFSSERAFDLHRVGDYSLGRKRAGNLPSVGLELDSRGRWRLVR